MPDCHTDMKDSTNEIIRERLRVIKHTLFQGKKHKDMGIYDIMTRVIFEKLQHKTVSTTPI